MWSLNLLPVFKNLIHKIVWNEMELNSYRSSCHRFIPRCLTLVNGLHEIFPVNKLVIESASPRHIVWLLLILQRLRRTDGACSTESGLDVCFMFSLTRFIIHTNTKLTLYFSSFFSFRAVYAATCFEDKTIWNIICQFFFSFLASCISPPVGSRHILFSIVYRHHPHHTNPPH